MIQSGFLWRRIDRLAGLFGPLVLFGLIIWFADWTGPNQPSAALEAVWVLLTSGAWAMVWLTGAVGFGWPLRRLLAPGAVNGATLQIGIGIAAMLALDATLGALGWLQIGGSIGAWSLSAGGIALLIIQVARSGWTLTAMTPPPWVIWLAAPPLAVMLVAACSAPGLLWTSEFGGYDALSYHLQLPKEWLALGRIQPLEHNVYSYFPSFMEAAYYHLAVLMGDGVSSVYACQLLHAAMALLTAGCVGGLVSRLANPMIGAVAAVIVFSTPWVTVVGSLAYNEMAVTLMLAVGLLAISEPNLVPWRKGALIGLLSGAACGAKLTALGMVAVPLGAALLFSIPMKRWPGAVAVCGLAFLLALSPYLVRNQVYAGNPVFPFATSIFGLGHWTDEQATAWSTGHRSDAGLGERFIELWNQFCRYGMGENPTPGEPWKLQWSIIPVLSLLALIAGFLWGNSRRWICIIGIILLVQIVFWMDTHLKSRFMVPSVVPMAIAIGLGVDGVRRRYWTNRRTMPITTTLAAVDLLILTFVGVWIYQSEGRGGPSAAIGRAGAWTGDELSPSDRLALGTTTFPTVAVNHLLPPDSKVLFIGEAAPLYYRLDRIVYQTTWDRGPLSKAMGEFPDNSAHWRQVLHAQGFTHVLVHETMLRIWEQNGWNDPLLTRDRVNQFVKRFGEALYEYPGDVKVYRLKE